MAEVAGPLQIARTTPMAEARAAQAGAMDLASAADHVHPRLSSATEHVLDASGEATVTFTRTFTARPNPILTYEEAADGQPVSLKVKSWARANGGTGDYTGCVVKGYRAQVLPSTILTLAGLVSLNVAAGGSASGVTVFVTMLQKS